MQQSRYKDFEDAMQHSALVLTPALRFSLGNKFHQDYPAGGEHKDSLVFRNQSVEDIWRSWQWATLRWRQEGEAFRLRKGRFDGSGNAA